MIILLSYMSNHRILAFVCSAVILIAVGLLIALMSNKSHLRILELQSLRAIFNKNKINYESYKLIKEKYEEIKIIQHDFNKYMNAIEPLLTKEQSEALSALNILKSRTIEAFSEFYTENKILNILLSQRVKTCSENGISFNCFFEDPCFNFINEIDLVSIFSNLIDNAIESCIISKEKNIYLNSYIVNNAYTVVKIENSADLKPKIKNGNLITDKKDKSNHGFGIKSILKAIRPYNGSMQWEHDEEHNIFRTIIMFNSTSKNKRSKFKHVNTNLVKSISLFR